MADYLRDLPCGLFVGQAAHEIPKYRSGLQRAIRRTREKDIALADNDKTCTSAAKCTLRVGSKVTAAIVDSGAATTIMTKPLLEKLGYHIDRPSNMIVIIANGTKT